jgi:hypothetical protein
MVLRRRALAVREDHRDDLIWNDRSSRASSRGLVRVRVIERQRTAAVAAMRDG